MGYLLVFRMAMSLTWLLSSYCWWRTTSAMWNSLKKDSYIYHGFGILLLISFSMPVGTLWNKTLLGSWSQLSPILHPEENSYVRSLLHGASPVLQAMSRSEEDVGTDLWKQKQSLWEKYALIRHIPGWQSICCSWPLFHLRWAKLQAMDEREPEE